MTQMPPRSRLRHPQPRLGGPALAMPGAAMHERDPLGFATPDFRGTAAAPARRPAAPPRAANAPRAAAGPAAMSAGFGRIAAVGALALVGAAAFGQIAGIGDGAVAATLETQVRDGIAVDPMPFERNGDSFPGSAYYYLDTSAEAPLAPAAHWDSDTAGVGAGADGMDPGPAAQALRQAGTPIDRMRALDCLTQAIYYEAASEPDAGQRAVAQVVLNRMAHPAYPKTVCGVVYQGSERSTGCQFTFTCDGALARHPVKLFWDRARAVAAQALAGYVYSPVGLATHYHTFAVHPYWADSLHFLGQIGAHRFYRMAGPAGAPAAFRFAYAGGEPMAAPLPRSQAAGAASSPDPLSIERAYEARLRAAHGDPRAVGLIAATAPAAPPPAYAGEALQRGGDAAFRARALPGGDGVRAEYQASGTWIANPE